MRKNHDEQLANHSLLIVRYRKARSEMRSIIPEASKRQVVSVSMNEDGIVCGETFLCQYIEDENTDAENQQNQPKKNIRKVNDPAKPPGSDRE